MQLNATPEKAKKWKLNRYLERIAMEPPKHPNRWYLDRLIERHMIAIPFEALDLYTGRAKIALDLDCLFEKIVENHRGGYCFELNKLFHFLLKELGYDAYSCFCRVQEGGIMSEAISHRGIIVRMEGKKFFCDVGFGNYMSRGAIELVPNVRQRIGTDIYWFEKYNEYWLDLFRQPQNLINEDGSVTVGRSRRELRVCVAEMEEQDFEVFNTQFNMPGSYFSECLMVGKLTENGALAINDQKIFSRIEGNYKIHSKLKNERELWAVLREEFGIVMDVGNA